nr:flagellar hook-length control protein FliK [uncultured Acetobacterium sp.]
MNLEIQSAGKPTMKGLMGTSARTESSRVNQSEGNDKSAQFKDLLHQSKQDIKQADHQLETNRENRRDLKELDDNQKTEDSELSTETQSKDNTGKVDNDQVTETEPKELLVDQNQVDSSLLMVENAQLMGIQTVQGNVENVLANLNIKLGSPENEVPDNLVAQVTSSQLVDVKGVNTEVLATTAVPLFNGTQIEEIQSGVTNGEMMTNLDNPATEMIPGGVAKAKPETVLTDGLSTEGESSQTKTIDQLITQNVDSQNQQTISEDTNAENAKSQKIMDSTNRVNTATFNAELAKASSGEDNTVQPTENQSLGEKGVHEINMASTGAAKGSEVQPNNTPVVQQVAQKILQNFEPNKPMVLQMTLSPEKLGDIEVQLKYDQGKLVIDIMAASRETQNLLGKQINQLVRGLALQNVQVETVHINTPVEASSTGGNTSSLMNSGSDFSQQQNNAQLRESFLRNSSIQNSLLGNGSESDDDGIISIAQNLQYNGQRRINYYV